MARQGKYVVWAQKDMLILWGLGMARCLTSMEHEKPVV